MSAVLRYGSIACLLLLLACSSSAPATTQPAAGEQPPGQPAAPTINRTLVMAGRAETPSVASRPLRVFGLTSSTVSRLFNAGLALRDGEGNYRPYLAEALPQLNTDSWKVSPDGRMETTYRLRPNLTWHDGTPFSAEDYVFGWRTYANPDLGLSRTSPFDAIDEVMAPDARTLVIRWKQPYPDAGHLAGRDRQLPALPRLLLQAAQEGEPADTFANLPYWT